MQCPAERSGRAPEREQQSLGGGGGEGERPVQGKVRHFQAGGEAGPEASVGPWGLGGQALIRASCPPADLTPFAWASGLSSKFLCLPILIFGLFHTGHQRGRKPCALRASVFSENGHGNPTLSLPRCDGSQRGGGYQLQSAIGSGSPQLPTPSAIFLPPSRRSPTQRRGSGTDVGQDLLTSLRSRHPVLWRAEGRQWELEPQPSRAREGSRVGPGNPLPPQWTPTRSGVRL